MHVYFVRHGETLKNRRHIHQSPNTPLSSKGKEQAITAAEALRGVNPDLLISSEYTRALETARVIGLHTGLTPVVNGLFYEIVRPSKFFETSVFSLETLWYVFLSLIHRNNPKWRYADAENLSDVTERARRAIKYLESLTNTHASVVVVSHTVMINILVSALCTHKMYDFWGLLLIFLNIDRMKNGSIIHLEYTGPAAPNTCAWRIVGG